MPEETTTVAPTTTTTLCPTTTPNPQDSMYISVNSYYGTVPHSIILNLEDYCPLEYSSYIINFGDNLIYTTYNSISNLNYTYYNDGSYIITLSAVTIDGETVLKNSGIIEVSIVPTVDTTNINVTQDNNKIDVDFDPDDELNHQKIEIDYGDGTKEEIDKKDFNNITHVYDSPGHYVITMVATDENGTQHIYYNTEITISEPPNNPNNVPIPGMGGGGGGIVYNTQTTAPPVTQTTPKIPVTPEWVTTTVCECYPPVPTTPQNPPPFSLPTTVPSSNAVSVLTTPPPVDPLTPNITTTTTTTTTTLSPTTTSTTTTVVPFFTPCKTNCNSLNY